MGRFAPEIFGTEDYDLWVRILERGYRAVLNPDRLAVYRVTSGSVSSNAARQGENSQMVYTRALGRGDAESRRDPDCAKPAAVCRSDGSGSADCRRSKVATSHYEAADDCLRRDYPPQRLGSLGSFPARWT